MTEAITTTPDVSNLRAGEIFTKPVTVDGWEPDFEDESWSWFEGYEYTDDNDRTVTLIVRDGSVTRVHIDGRTYERGSDDYEYEHTDDEGELTEGAFSEEDFDALFDLDVETHGCEGPMMNYWYPFESITDQDEATGAAAKIADLPLCVVEVQGSYGLALTGGGMNMSWYIVGAYVRLGYLPPLHFVSGIGSPVDEAGADRATLIAACLRTLDVARDCVEQERQWFTERFAGEA